MCYTEVIVRYARLHELFSPSFEASARWELDDYLEHLSLASEIVRRFARDFVARHWPGTSLPDLYYDPRALAENNRQRASLHAKCVVVGRRIAVITSANFTEAAQRKNIEVGVLIRYEPFVTRLSSYLEGLRNSGQLACCPLR